MGRVELEQGSQDWLDYRLTGVGASECSAVMGNNPWKSAFRLWQEIMGEVGPPPTNDAMARGIRLEPEARSLYNLTYGHKMQPACYECDELPFIRASLDGISKDGKRALEIKCPGLNTFEKISDTMEVPSYYLDNCQQQILCSNVDALDFYVYFPGKEPLLIEVLPNEEHISMIIEKVTEFWGWVLAKEWPGVRPDYSLLIDDPVAQPVFSEYLSLLHKRNELTCRIKAVDEAMKELKPKVLDFSDSGPCHGFGLKIVERSRKGNVNYEKLCKERGITDSEKESYRKGETHWLEIKELS